MKGSEEQPGEVGVGPASRHTVSGEKRRIYNIML